MNKIIRYFFEKSLMFKMGSMYWNTRYKLLSEINYKRMSKSHEELILSINDVLQEMRLENAPIRCVEDLRKSIDRAAFVQNRFGYKAKG